jgi:HSP20 family molecular chaperone IbpA
MTTETTTQPALPRAGDKQVLEREATRPGLVFRPDVDIVEQKDAFLVSADLPGVDEGSVEVRLENGLLSIDAPPGEAQDAAWTPLYAEYRTGGYHREFALSDAIDVTGIEARLTDGVLEVRLPKRHEARPRRITIQAG